MSDGKIPEQYDPKSALKALRKAAKKGEFVPPVRPTSKTVGDEYQISKRPPFFCMPLGAFTAHPAPKELPDDIRGLIRTGAALKAHVRPDGAVFLGAFELPDQPGSTIIVFGDALADREFVQRVSIEFRRRLERVIEANDRIARNEQASADNEIIFPTKPELVQ